MANEAGIPICVVYQGGIGLIDAETRPNLFRIAPTDRGKAFRLAEYMLPKGLLVGFLHDDTDLGQQGVLAVEDSFGRVEGAIVADVGIPDASQDPSPQVVEARQAGATALLVWGQPSTIAEVVTAARSSGWDVPIYTPQTGADPLVRQQLATHPEWVDGLTFASVPSSDGSFTSFLPNSEFQKPWTYFPK